MGALGSFLVGSLLAIPLLAALLVGTGCKNDAAAKKAERDPVVDAAARPDKACEDRARWTAVGGAYLARPDGATLYHETAGPPDAPAVLYVHGGPGYNAYTFRQAVGAALEQTWRMVYVDQRGMGRSVPLPASAAVGGDATFADFEALRAHLGIEQWHVAGHSFGGPLAVQYKSAYPGAVSRLALIDTAADLGAALLYQVTYAASVATANGWDQSALDAIAARRDEPSTQRLAALYNVVGRLPLQGALHFATSAGQATMERWDQESGLLPCTDSRSVKAYIDAGVLDKIPDNVAVALDGEGKLFVGEKSHVIGPGATAHAQKVWNVDVERFADAGHFVYLEAPEAFVAALTAFFQRPFTDDDDCVADAFGFGLTLQDPHTGEAVKTVREDRHVRAETNLTDGTVLKYIIGGCAHVGEQMELTGPRVDALVGKGPRAMAAAASAMLALVRVNDGEGQWTVPGLKLSLDAALAASPTWKDEYFDCGAASCDVSFWTPADQPDTKDAPYKLFVNYSFAM